MTLCSSRKTPTVLSGLGPGGRRFESCCPDHYKPAENGSFHAENSASVGLEILTRSHPISLNFTDQDVGILWGASAPGTLNFSGRTQAGQREVPDGHSALLVLFFHAAAVLSSVAILTACTPAWLEPPPRPSPVARPVLGPLDQGQVFRAFPAHAQGGVR